jgi:hypothetical protein
MAVYRRMVFNRILRFPDPAAGGNEPANPPPPPEVTPANPPPPPATAPIAPAPAASAAPPRVALAVVNGKTEGEIAAEMQLEAERNRRIQVERDNAALADENTRLKQIPAGPKKRKAKLTFFDPDEDEAEGQA